VDGTTGSTEAATYRPAALSLSTIQSAMMKGDVELEKMVNNFMNLDMSDDMLLELVNILAYNGFSAKEFRKFVIFAQNVVNPAPGHLGNFIKTAILLMAMRGSKIRDMTKTKKAAEAWLKFLTDCGLDLNPPAGTLPANKITLQRVMSSFAPEYSNILATTSVRIVGDAPNGYPNFLSFSSGLSLIPKALGKGTNLYDGWVAWQDSFTNIITAKLSAEDKKKTLDNQQNFRTIIHNSDLIDKDSVRYQVLLEGLMRENHYRRVKGGAGAVMIGQIYQNEIMSGAAVALGKDGYNNLVRDVVNNYASGSHFAKHKLPMTPLPAIA